MIFVIMCKRSIRLDKIRKGINAGNNIYSKHIFVVQ